MGPPTTTLGQSGLESNGNEGVFHIPQSSRTRASPSDGHVIYKTPVVKGLTPLQRCSQSIV